MKPVIQTYYVIYRKSLFLGHGEFGKPTWGARLSDAEKFDGPDHEMAQQLDAEVYKIEVHATKIIT